MGVVNGAGQVGAYLTFTADSCRSPATGRLPFRTQLSLVQSCLRPGAAAMPAWRVHVGTVPSFHSPAVAFKVWPPGDFSPR